MHTRGATTRNIFDRIDEMTSRAVDRESASAFVCTPMRSTPNGRSPDDPDRPAWEGTGVFSEETASAGVEIGNRNRSGNDLRTIAAGSSYGLSVDRNRHPSADSVRQGDGIEIGERGFEVLAVQSHGSARVVLRLSGTER